MVALMPSGPGWCWWPGWLSACSPTTIPNVILLINCRKPGPFAGHPEISRAEPCSWRGWWGSDWWWGWWGWHPISRQVIPMVFKPVHILLPNQFSIPIHLSPVASGDVLPPPHAMLPLNGAPRPSTGHLQQQAKQGLPQASHEARQVRQVNKELNSLGSNSCKANRDESWTAKTTMGGHICCLVENGCNCVWMIGSLLFLIMWTLKKWNRKLCNTRTCESWDMKSKPTLNICLQTKTKIDPHHFPNIVSLSDTQTKITHFVYHLKIHNG